MKVHERFLNYVKFDTQSVPDVEIIPSSDKQKILGQYLVEEMKSLGIKDAFMDEHCYVYGTLEKNTDKNTPVIGFIAHMDTSPDMPGNDIKARIIENYDGSDIVLNSEKDITMKTEMFEHLLNYVGNDLIVTDGTTLLGADNKAGIAEILSMAEYFVNNPDVEHGTIKIAFTPDEEVGSGADMFDVKGFGADFAYTVDGGELGEIEYENFNAASAKVTINGVNIHPGSAKNKMKNSILIGMEFQNMLPIHERPDSTENYEGFSHLNDMSGDVEKTHLNYIIRDHSNEKFEAKKDRFLKTADFLNSKYGEGTVIVELKDSYYNMKEKILPHMHIIETAKQALLNIGIEPEIVPIRGGTDGARLSYMGLPCPNLCTGGHNYHGRYEYIPVQSMEKVVEMLKEIVRLYTK
ncbi:MAG: peptidase T [Sedimentibacter saalensis]|uniref:Peptidase T n=1 Tax=Sedimentibacter saalensis TaxID=130788 RepID=A0A562J8H0_9FIRM|nr:peptidase T [Sedimentibacter saalensis]MEA5093434.1 peptidase T [Sedimentibacter saalensis]TWH79323.1 tripeptide aminopeptidase [Sedimentibacter saalensis]